MNIKISHIEYYLPDKIVKNEDLAKENPEWNFSLIVAKTGIIARHVAKKNENASDLSVNAAEKIFQKGYVDRNSIDTIIFCTQSPDFQLPTTACILQERLNLPISTAAFDFNLGCSGYIYGLAISNAMVKGGISRKVLLLCAETYSKYISKTDRTTRTVFGDGGSATVVERSNDSKSIGPFILRSDGRGWEKIIVRQDIQGSRLDKEVSGNSKGRLYVDGAGVLMFTMRRVPECVHELLEKSKKSIDDIDMFIFHQASKVVIDNIIRILSLKETKVFRGYEKIGNTISASIPIALKQAEEQNRLKAGDLIMLVGFGVGLSWGSCLIKW